MKKFLFIMCAVFMIGLTSVSALETEDLNGFTQEEYNKLLEFGFTPADISSFNDIELENLHSANLLTSKVETKYIKETSYKNRRTKKVIDTKEEYISYEQYKNARKETGIALMNTFSAPIESVEYETSYKKLTLIVSQIIGSNTDVLITVKTVWHIMPQTRSFDLMATRVTNGVLLNNSQSGRYTYTFTHGDSACDRVVSSTLYTEFTDNSYWTKQNSNDILFQGYTGAGVAFKLQHDGFARCYNDISFISSEVIAMDSWIMTRAKSIFGSIGVYATYQHATSNVNLSSVVGTYNFSSSGLGGVINFTNGMSSYYDGMSGVSMTY